MNLRVTAVQLLTLAFIQQPSNWRPIDITGASKQPLDPSACRWEGNSGFRRLATGRIEVDCGTPTAAMLQCDVPGHESRDLASADLCRSPSVTLDAGVPVRIESDVQSDVGVRWFRWADTPSPEIRAERRATNVPAFGMLSAPATFVRFSVPGLSPITVSTETLTAEPTWTLAHPGIGGELFAKQQSGVVVPDAVEVVGRQSATLPIDRGWIDLPRLAEGVYSMRRVYPGGLRTPAVTAAVGVGQSTDAWLPLENVGGVHIIANATACEAGDRMELMDGRRASTVNGVTRATPVVNQSSACEWRVGGLTPGPYMIQLTPFRDAPIVTRAFEARAQQWTEVLISGPPVVVHGRVRLLGEPAAGLELTFGRIGDVPDAASVLIKPNGHYALGFENPGPYETALKTPMNTRFDKTELLLGDNEYNIDLKGGKIRVWFSDFVPKENISLWMDTPSGLTTAHFGSTRPGIELTVYEYGTFGIGGSAVDGKDKGVPVNRYQTVEINERFPRVNLEFWFAPFTEDLYPVDQNGRPLPDGRYLVPQNGRPVPFARVPPVKTANSALPLGTPLQLETSNARTCLTLTEAGRANVSFPTSMTSVEFRFEHAGDDLAGMVTSVPGATCGVPLRNFPFTRQKSERYEAVRVLLPNGSLVLERDGKKYPIRVPAGGPVVIK